MSRPLASLFSSPRQLLAKAHRDQARLEAAIDERNETAVAEAMIDAFASVYHVKDWIAAIHPEQKTAAQDHEHASEWIRLCRDICLAGKHFEVDRSKPTVTGTDNSSALEAFGDLPLLSICTSTGTRHYAPKVISNAIDDWECFLSSAAIP